MGSSLTPPESPPCPSAVRAAVLRTLHVTRHAHDRCQQRSVPPSALPEIVRFGRIHRVRGGNFAFFLGRRSQQLAASWGTRLDMRANIVVIAAVTGSIVTVYRTNTPRRIRGGSR